MSRLRLKRYQVINEELQHRISEIKDNAAISDDNSMDDFSKEDTDTEIVNENANCDKKRTVFSQSTDSLSDDSTAEPSFTSGSKPTPLFKWNHREIRGRNRITSDSSDDEVKEITKPWRKKCKTNIETPMKAEIYEIRPDVPGVVMQHQLMIAGINVKLPVRPYSCQIAVINKLIQGCVKKENCLLESPTGSGKTLALLCGVLAWHDFYTDEINKRNCDAAFQDDAKPSTSSENNEKCDPGDSDVKCIDLDDSYEDEEFSDDNKKKIKIPKIYYCTRTHKQIEQVVRELRKTAYRHKKMTILSSREHTCIQQSTKNKTELCNELLDPQKHKGGCPFYNDSNKKTLSTFPAVERRGLGSVWDIEDLVAIGKYELSCPYFAARSLMEYADIIFCPYNYIIDPDIRGSMQLDLKNQVIILDEAHNIEDICRESASVSFREDHLKAAAEECEAISKQRIGDLATYDTLKAYMLKLVDFLKFVGLNKEQQSYNTDTLTSSYWTGAELVELFNMNGLGESEYSMFLTASNAAIADANKAKDEIRFTKQKKVKPIISNSTKTLIEHLMFTMRMITSLEYMNDYRACVTESTVKDFKYVAENTWMSAKKCENRVRTLKLMCMNPGVIFSPLAANAHSIILASGTLTPTCSFQSELRTTFAHVLNTAHVIPKEQIYATCIPRGPSNINLKANYSNVNSWAFQDELGRVLLDICESVPHGVLCFFSSYNVMHTQMDRWKNNNIWNKITNVKQVFIEPRYGGDLTAIMNDYRQEIEDTSTGPRGRINGALFLAVFRGKVAEGIDFRDNEARCVVTVGIPYAVVKDPVIDMKWKYNDRNFNKGLLKGSEWYNIQAFRALNQALGRCLRHINDWGAVLLVDERFLKQENMDYLPKWVKMMWVKQNSYNLKQDLRNFVARQKERERNNKLT